MYSYKFKPLSEYDTPTGEHTCFQTRMFGDVFRIRKDANGTFSIWKKERLSNDFITIKEGLLGLKPAKKYFARYIL